MKRKNEHLPHEIAIDGEVGKLTAYTKKRKPVVATFDAMDRPLLEKFHHWRAVWSNEFDCQLVESKDLNDEHAVRTPVAAAILGCSPNAPIRHLNGDILDNRRTNLEIYDVKTQPNEYVVNDGWVEMILKDRYGRPVGTCYFDQDDLNLVTDGHIWRKKSRPTGQPYVVNTEGRLLAYLLLGVDDGFVTYINKNPLDNSRKNLRLEALPKA